MLSKKIAAERAVLCNLQNNMVVGIGSGSTMVFVVEKIKEIVLNNKWTIKCVPSSFQAKELINTSGLDLYDITQFDKLDLCFDGADEFDKRGNLIKGGGGAHFREKLVCSLSKKVVIVVDESKKSNYLGEKVFLL